MTKIVDEIEKVLGGVLDNTGNLSRQTVEKYSSKMSDLEELLYINYTNPKPQFSVDDEVLDDSLPFLVNFNEKRFWFTNKRNKKQMSKDLVFGFQDGVGSIFTKGEFLNGGKIFEESSRSTSETEVLLNNTSEDVDFKNFIHVYHANKLFKSRNNYYIIQYGDFLTRNKNKQLIRYYFNIDPRSGKEKITALITFIKTWFNDRKIPFQFKLPENLNNFNRSDNFVLYLSQNHFYISKSFIHDLLFSFEIQEKGLLYDLTPLFLKKLIPGIGFAEDPIDSEESFGSSRCKIVLRAIHEIFSNSEIQFINPEIIATKIKSYGFRNGLFRNPYTNFTYNFDFSTAITPLEIPYARASLFNFLNSKYAEISLSYALELIEKAIWLSEDDFSWINYNEDSGQCYYHFLDDSETIEIFNFLYQIMRIENFRRLIPLNVQKIIVRKRSISINNTSFLDKLENLDRGLASLRHTSRNNSLEDLFRGAFESFTLKRNLRVIYKLLVRGKPIYRVIKEEKIYKLSLKLSQKDTIINVAEDLYDKYLKINYPIKNNFGNYEYCPNKNGKIAIARMFLFLYNSELID